MKEFMTNRPMKRMSAQKREEYEKATQCYIYLHSFVKDDPKGLNVRDHDHITGFFIGAAHRQCNLESPVSLRSRFYFTTSVDTTLT